MPIPFSDSVDAPALGAGGVEARLFPLGVFEPGLGLAGDGRLPGKPPTKGCLRVP